jgi:hypothetical protein
MSPSNGEFEMTTDFDNNSYVQNGNLYIMPTLTSDAIGSEAIFTGNYTVPGCTSTVQNSVGQFHFSQFHW